MTQLTIRLIEYVVLVIAFGGMAIDLVIGFWDDYGAPWRRKAGTNGRWRTDLFVIVLVATLGAICAGAFAATVLGEWRGARTTTTALLGVLAVAVVGLWVSGKVERRKVERRGDAAADRTERAADAAIAASDDARRSAHRTEEAAEKVIELMDDREIRADEREERSEARENVSRQREERMDDREIRDDEREERSEARELVSQQRENQAKKQWDEDHPPPSNTPV